ncbi:MAG TPA: hypothetical protein VFD59_08340 [Nocardioidaceae bacterium]|nr:hypothetical protein [Nocardioidaceae bacterium]
MSLPQYIEDLAFLHVNPNYVPLDPEHPDVKAYLERRSANGTIAPKRGEEMFEGTDYPREWEGFVGQTQAKEELQIKVASAQARGARLDHTMLASGQHGCGKSTLAMLLAYQYGAGSDLLK